VSVGVLRTRLRNGLEVRLKEIHTAPLISSWVWYRVGSRNERSGITGASHLVEHMQFKGTPHFPAGVLDKAISRDGGYWQAWTWLDWTTYFETMPAGSIDLALRLEADRMVHSLFDADEFVSERTVVISERQGSENEPTFRLAEEVQAAAFRIHPYSHEVIGHMADLETMSREDLYRHYRTYYVPGNAVLTIAGDFQSRAMLARVRELYGDLPSGRPASRPSIPAEPRQHGEKRVVVEGPGETPYLDIAYHVPGAAHEDFIALSVLDSALAGASSLNLFGGGISNKTSRLYKALVERELVAAVGGGLVATVDPYVYSVQATVRPDRTPEQALQAYDDEVARLLDHPISAEEVAKAIKQARALFAYGSESITNQAFWLGYSEMFADYTWFESYLERIARVTPGEVHAAAQKYLAPSNRVVGIYRPTGDQAHA
jgi:zinc protease